MGGYKHNEYFFSRVCRFPREEKFEQVHLISLKNYGEYFKEFCDPCKQIDCCQVQSINTPQKIIENRTDADEAVNRI